MRGGVCESRERAGRRGGGPPGRADRLWVDQRPQSPPVTLASVSLIPQPLSCGHPFRSQGPQGPAVGRGHSTGPLRVGPHPSVLGSAKARGEPDSELPVTGASVAWTTLKLQSSPVPDSLQERGGPGRTLQASPPAGAALHRLPSAGGKGWGR